MRKPVRFEIPTLPFAVLERVQAVQDAALRGLLKCGIPGTEHLNHDRAAEVMCSCALEEIEIRLNHYTALPDFRIEWTIEIAEKTIDSCLGCFPNYTFKLRQPGLAIPDQERKIYEDARQFFKEIESVVAGHLLARIWPPQTATPMPSTPEPLPKPKEPVSRTSLRDSYMAQFPDERIVLRDLSFAVGQRYREWTRWLAGESKDGSTPDLAFRRILESGKRPHEFNKKRRPKNWE